jgi:tRNA nucleotidyltransferase/poly(A) polymerase
MSPEQFAFDVVRRLREAGYEALWAGGCVRDLLLGREPKDYDVATNAQPEEVRAVFGHRRTLAIGAAFGVIMVQGPKGLDPVEVATFRQDAEYTDGRRPSGVVFTNAENDALRRDFTINGMFYDPVTEHVIDYVGGRHDLSAGIVRAIGNAYERFTEDKLRLLRAVRFAATFDFTLEAETHAAVLGMADQIAVVSAERICQELRRMLMHDNRKLAARMLFESGLLAATLPELMPLATRPHPDSPATDWDYTLELLNALAKPEFGLALATLLGRLIDAQQSDEARGRALQDILLMGERLKLSNHDLDRTMFLVRHQADLDNATHKAWSFVQPLLINPAAHDLVALHAAREHVRSELTDTPIRRVDLEFCWAKLALPAEELNPPPLLNGHDLMTAGIPKGPIYSLILKRVRAAQLDGEVSDREGALQLAEKLGQGGQ